MEIKHLETIHPPSKKLKKVAAVCWANNNRRLAVADCEGMVTLFDENGKRRDRFASKSASGKRGGRQYIIKSMSFSPDDVRLALAQSDNIVFVYKLGLEWGDKKSICNKFQQSSSVTCMCWPHLHPFEIVFGLTDGRVRVGNLRSNKIATLYATDSPVVSLSPSPDGHGIISGHLDGSIYRFYFIEAENDLMDPDVMTGDVATMVPGHQKITQHSCVPTCLAWGRSIIVAGPDFRVVSYGSDGSFQQSFDLTSHVTENTDGRVDHLQREFTSTAINPSGQSIVFGSFNRMTIFNFNPERQLWEEGEEHDIENMYSVTCMSWKPDGSCLIVGNSCGSVEMFDTCLRRLRHKREFEFTFVSPSQVIVKRLSTGRRTILKSNLGHEILRINVSKDQFLVAHTPRTLLLGNLDSFSLSEVVWQSVSGDERFFFDNPEVCLVHNAGEMAVIEYGINEIIGSFRTDHISPHLISIRVSYSAHKGLLGNTSRHESVAIDTLMDLEGNKKVAYLLDSHTIRILDLVSSTLVSNISHDSKIDWLELNTRANMLLFRDKRHTLNLFDIRTQKRITLLTYCNYVQWVPGSDVVVAQNRSDLCVWYNIDAPDRVTIVPIKGQIHDIMRTQGVTTVYVDEGSGTIAPYELDEGLIEFGNAMEDKDYQRAADILEDLVLTSETEVMWKNLSELALQDNRLQIAERCYAALGDVARARFLRKLHTEVEVHEIEGSGSGSRNYQTDVEHWRVRAQMAILHGDFKTAELLYLEQGRVEDAMSMYEKVHRFEESINLAIARGVPDAQKKKQKYIEWLINTKQEEKAARIHEQDGKIVEAINLYLKGGFPASAANVVIRHGITGGYHQGLLDTIADKLKESGLWTKAGEFYEKRSQSDSSVSAEQQQLLLQNAVDCFRKGNAYRSAVELCRSSFPQMVVRIEDEWGDYLVQQKQLESAIHHFIEANQYTKAIEAAISSRQWSKAEQILTGLDKSAAKQYCRRIAMRYEEIQDLDKAKAFYLRAETPQEALRMFQENNQWDQVHLIAESYMSPTDIKKLYMKQAAKLDDNGRYKDAEKLYINAGEVDHAINMYKLHHMFDDMIRLVSQYRNVHLSKAHLQIANKLESEGQLRQAEHHYIQSGDWKAAVVMYRNNDKWNEAIQVAKAHGSSSAWKRVAKEWAVTIGGESGGEAGAKLLYKLNLVEEAIDYCLERSIWTTAFDMARTSLKSKLPDVHLKYAIILEDNRRFKEAEDEYINAQAPKEAIEMYIHEGIWIDALRVAETYEPNLINYVLESQAEVAFEEGEYERAEELFIQAKKVERIIEKYKETQRFEDAKRVADKYLGPDAQRMVKQQWAQQQMPQTQQQPHTLLQQHQQDLHQEQLAHSRRDTRNTQQHSKTNNDPAAAARMFLETGEYSKAIDAYLECQTDRYESDFVDKQWIHAISVAMNNLQVRLGDVCQEVIRRFLQAQKIEQAGRVFVMTGQMREAVELFVKRKMWNEARNIAQQRNPDLLPYIEQHYKKSLLESQQPEDLVEGGNIIAAMEALAARQQWDECLQLGIDQQEYLREQGKIDVLDRYAAEYIKGLLRPHQPLQHAQALDVIVRHGILPVHDATMFSAYVEITKRIVWNVSPTISENQKLITSLKDALFRLVDKLLVDSQSVFSDQQRLIIGRYCDVVHYMNMMNTLEGNKQCSALYAKVCISLARYCDIAPPDMVFLFAGMAARRCYDEVSAARKINIHSEVGGLTEDDWEDMTFLFLNRFVDLSHEIEESSEEDGTNDDTLPLMSMSAEGEITVARGYIELDNDGFDMTDIPTRVLLPRECFADEKTREEVLDYVTVLSVNKSQHSLHTVQCENCQHDMYAANLQCLHCSYSYEPCIITGYPVMVHNRIECTNCKKSANKDDWNLFHMHHKDPRCPCCNEISILMD